MSRAHYQNFEKLKKLISGQLIAGKRTTYQCILINEFCIVFGETEGTNKVMIPTEVALEWISSYEEGLIFPVMPSREMKNVVKEKSIWAAYQHGFETHLSAIVRTWAEFIDE